MGKWEMVRLSEAADFNMGQSPSSESYNDEGQGVPFFQGKTDFGLMYPTVRMYCTEPKKIAEKDDILISVRAPVGAVNIATGTCCIGRGLAAISQKNGTSDYKYLYYFLKYKENDIANMGVGSTFKAISKKDLDAIEIPFPPLPVQRQIADVLDRTSALIEKRKAQIDKLDLLVKSQFVEMFGDPVTNPKGWEVRKLKEIASTIQSGNTPKGGKQVYVDSGIMFFRSQNVWRNRIELDDIAYIDENTHKKMSPTKLKNKDILITKTGRFNTENSSLGRAALFLGKDDSANINGHVYLVRLAKCCVHEYILYILITDEYRDYIRKVCVGGIDKRQINKEHLEEFPIIMPPAELQYQFADFFLQVEAQKSLLQQSLAKLEQNYKSLMQKCFRGEIF